MKKLTKMLLSAGVTLMLGTGVVLSYLQAQPGIPPVSDLTLANLEAMAFMDPDDPNNPDKEGGLKIPCRSTGDEYDYCSFVVVVTTDGKSKMELLQGFINDDL